MDDSTKIFLIIFCIVLFGSIFTVFVLFFKGDHERYLNEREKLERNVALLKLNAGPFADKDKLTAEEEISMTPDQRRKWIYYQAGKNQQKHADDFSVDLFGPDELGVKLRKLGRMLFRSGGFIIVFFCGIWHLSCV